MSPDTAAPIHGQKEPQCFRLLDLPDELWAKIGKLAIEDSLVSTINRPTPLAIKTKPHPITQTCSVLRKELRIGYYQTKVEIELEPEPNDGAPRNMGKAIGHYLRVIGPDAAEKIKTTYKSGWYAADYYPNNDAELYLELQMDLEELEDAIGMHAKVLSKRMEFRDGLQWNNQRLCWEISFVQAIPQGGRRMLDE